MWPKRLLLPLTLALKLQTAQLNLFTLPAQTGKVMSEERVNESHLVFTEFVAPMLNSKGTSIYSRVGYIVFCNQL